MNSKDAPRERVVVVIDPDNWLLKSVKVGEHAREERAGE